MIYFVLQFRLILSTLLNPKALAITRREEGSDFSKITLSASSVSACCITLTMEHIAKLFKKNNKDSLLLLWMLEMMF